MFYNNIVFKSITIRCLDNWLVINGEKLPDPPVIYTYYNTVVPRKLALTNVYSALSSASIPLLFSSLNSQVDQKNDTSCSEIEFSCRDIKGYD